MTDGTKALVERLRERAHAARDEKTATGICDALHFEEAADAIERLARERDEALAPVAWLYFNEDAGSEISYVHPINSGEVPDATDIRPIRDRAAVECIRDAWDCLRSERAEARAALDAVNGKSERSAA